MFLDPPNFGYSPEFFSVYRLFEVQLNIPNGMIHVALTAIVPEENLKVGLRLVWEDSTSEIFVTSSTETVEDRWKTFCFSAKVSTPVVRAIDIVIFSPSSACSSTTAMAVNLGQLYIDNSPLVSQKSWTTEKALVTNTKSSWNLTTVSSGEEFRDVTLSWEVPGPKPKNKRLPHHYYVYDDSFDLLGVACTNKYVVSKVNTTNPRTFYVQPVWEGECVPRLAQGAEALVFQVADHK